MDMTTRTVQDGGGLSVSTLAASDEHDNLASAGVLVAPDGTPLGRLGLYADITGTMTRQANTTAYASGDIVSDNVAAISLADFSPTPGGGGALIKSARLIIHQAAIPLTAFRAMLYNAAPSVITDNAPYNMLWADRGKRVGWIDFETAVAMGAGADCTEFQGTFPSGLPELAIQVPAVTALLALLVSVNAYTPASGIGIDLRITVGNQS